MTEFFPSCTVVGPKKDQHEKSLIFNLWFDTLDLIFRLHSTIQSDVQNASPVTSDELGLSISEN